MSTQLSTSTQGLILSAVLCLAITACGGRAAGPATPPGNSGSGSGSGGGSGSGTGSSGGNGASELGCYFEGEPHWGFCDGGDVIQCHWSDTYKKAFGSREACPTNHRCVEDYGQASCVWIGDADVGPGHDDLSSDGRIVDSGLTDVATRNDAGVPNG